jgi:hypothetical protein
MSGLSIRINSISKMISDDNADSAWNRKRIHVLTGQ